MQVSHNLGLTPTQATLILEATLPTLGNFIGYLVNGFSVKDAIQSGLIAGAIGVGGTMAASGALGEEELDEEQLDELSFLGSECTKDCSGHRAGYEWSKRKGLRQANSWSPSFNKGAGLAVAGK